MNKLQIEKFSLKTISDAVSESGVIHARAALSQFVNNAALDVSGKVQKVIKREGQEKLVIEPEGVPGFVVYAYFFNKIQHIKKAKIREDSPVSLRGKLASFGASAVCLNDCKLEEVGTKKGLRFVKVLSESLKGNKRLHSKKGNSRKTETEQK